MSDNFTLEELALLIDARAKATADQSYTRSLLEGGPAKIGKKLGEEAIEAVIAALQRDPVALRMEAADVLYHLMVLLQDGGVPLQDVIQELGRRTRQSGHEEKASRAK
jgi:phosphoribosyl-ATP pyrophosphohydrolase